MLQYLVILLDDTSTSYCHYENTRMERQLMPLDTLKRGIRFGMMENLMIQFVYPDYVLPQEYKDTIETIDHTKIVSSLCEDADVRAEADVIVFHDWTGIMFASFDESKSYVLRTSKADFFDRFAMLGDVLSKVTRLNVVITDVETMTDADFDRYKQVLASLAERVETLYASGKSPQLNLLTDRILLDAMNNCNAGVENITLAPDGRFYVCPAFYADGSPSVGDVEHVLDIKNPQLYRLDHAPLCRKCDAYQCRRCVWLNRKTTLEVNTPSHEQCVAAHLERNASRSLLAAIRRHGTFMPEKDIKEITYLDPFDVKEEL